MASGGERRMVFDVRGRRKHVVRVVYALLAVLMGLSLFLVVGGFNLSELFSSNSSSGQAAKPYEEQAERIEAKLRKEPESEQLLAALTRAQVSAGNTVIAATVEPSESELVEAVQHYQQASNSWSEYLEQTKEPQAGLAQLMAPALVQLAERGSRTLPQAERNIEAAAEAQRIVSEQRPTLNSLSTLALYTYFTGDYAAAEKAEAEAKKKAGAKFEVRELEKRLGSIKKAAKEFQKKLKAAEAAEETAAKGAKGNPESLENPANPLSGALAGAGLGE